MSRSMTSPWPRNIVPYDEARLRALADIESVDLVLRASDGALLIKDITPDERPVVDTLVAAGLLIADGDHLRLSNRHSRIPEEYTPGSNEHKRAVIAWMRRAVNEADALVDEIGDAARGAVGVITLPDDPETFARAVGILAEAEDQLRALAEDAPPGGGANFRVMLFVGSTRQ